MTYDEIHEAIDHLIEKMTIEDLPKLKEYFLALGSDYLVNDCEKPDDCFFLDLIENPPLDKKSGLSSITEYRIAILKIALEVGWPVFDRQLGLIDQIAYEAKWNHSIETTKFYEFLLDMGFDSRLPLWHTQEGTEETLSDYVDTEIAFSYYEGESPKTVMKLVPAWKTLLAHQANQPFHGHETYEAVLERKLTAVYALQKSPSGQTDYREKHWHFGFPDSVVFDFEGKYLVYDGECFVNPNVFNLNTHHWIDVSETFSEYLSLKLKKIKFKYDGESVLTTFEFKKNKKLNGTYNGQSVLFREGF